ncbi:hypothetical protein GCM10010517_06030 [Streptosporangium fragile]|uniref:Uncharacterized protein n=1 Tax=Streptosporangium fragile TaxID=46186 RepID=A0ABN3VRH6_9ACTN
MVRLLKRALMPAPLRRAVLGWLDSRYIPRADHRQDLKDALREVRTLSREVTTLRAEVTGLRTEVGELRARVATAGVAPDRAARWDDAHRLAQETAVAMDRVLQNEVLLWQAVDRAAGADSARPAEGVPGRPETAVPDGAAGAGSARPRGDLPEPPEAGAAAGVVERSGAGSAGSAR